MERDKLDFGNGKISSLFRAMFFPTLIGMAFNSALNICDGMFVGHGVGSDALAAINIVAPLFLICAGLGLMFGIGASVIGGIRLAEGNVKAARIIMTQAYIAGAVIFGMVILGSLLFTRPLLYMLGCSPALEELATDYLLWLLPGLVFFYLQCAGMMLIRLDGSPRYAMSVQIVAAVLNIFLDWYGVPAWLRDQGGIHGNILFVYRGRNNGGDLFHILFRQTQILPPASFNEVLTAVGTQYRIHGQNRTCDIYSRACYRGNDGGRKLYVPLLSWRSRSGGVQRGMLSVPSHIFRQQCRGSIFATDHQLQLWRTST